MKFEGKLLGLLLLVIGMVGPVAAQIPDYIMTESGTLLRQAPLDDIVDNSITMDKRVLPFDNPRAADVYWKRRVWRVIDVREKMNLPFAYPKRPLISILIEATKDEENPMRVFSDEEFQNEMDTNEINQVLFRTDTVPVTDPVTYEVKLEVIRNDINPQDIKRFRIKEVWYFDKESSTMKVRILGIAPIIPVKSDNGDVIGERPMFWVYYPETRYVLARERVFNDFNDASPITWDDLFEMRFFSSYIYKVSNVKDIRLQDEFAGRELLIEAEKLKEEIFNFEHDLWSY